MQYWSATTTVRIGESFIELKEGRLTSSDRVDSYAAFQPPGPGKLIWRYEGSILSSFARGYVAETFLGRAGLIDYLRHIRSFDSLSPNILRRHSRSAQDSIGFEGEDFAAYFDSLDQGKQKRLFGRLKEVYPRLDLIGVESSPQGRKRFKIVEYFDGIKTKTTARHINDGLLRLATLLAMLESDHEFLLFDEIENGINAELVDFFVRALIGTEKQILVTTHSPMILNYLEDHVA